MSNNLHIAEQWLQGMNEHDVNKMFNLCQPDMIGDEVAETRPNIGREAVAASYVDLFEGFPDCRSEIINEFSNSDQALIEIRWTGTNSGAFRGTPPSNKVVDVRIAYIFKFQGDRISRITEYYDGAAVAAQTA
jgi:steroid delta-isomerase-like uncharacterized protein